MSTLVAQLLELEIQLVIGSVLLRDVVLSNIHLVLRHLVSLDEVDDELILPLDDLLVLLDLRLVHLNLLSLPHSYGLEEVVETLDFNIKVSYLVIFQQGELVQFCDLLSSILFLRLVLLHHSDEGSHVITACFLEVLDDLLSSNHFLLVFFKLDC